MRIERYNAADRGHANHGWLDTYHTFSFANYHNPNRMHFGVLRVLNDDTVEGGKGFGMHPHENMEIISIPLEGDLAHQDSMGSKGVIRKGDVQVMSAGTGVLHSEMNANPDKEVKFLQIWLFPKVQNVEPRYDQLKISDHAKPNDFQQIVSPNKDDEGLWIHQDAWFSIADFQKDFAKSYEVKKEGNGVFVYVIEGKAKIGDEVIGRRDGVGIINTQEFTLEALENSEILIMDVPMELTR